MTMKKLPVIKKQILKTDKAIIASVPKHLFTVMADDIRMETGGKSSLIGVYGDGMVCKSLPTTYPQLCFYSRFLAKEGSYRVQRSLKDPAGIVAFGDEGSIAILNDGTFNALGHVSPFYAVAGIYTYAILIDGEEACKTVFSVEAEGEGDVKRGIQE